MGCAYSSDKITKNINKELKQQIKVERSLVRILLLGPGESGKSTFIRHMKIIHNGSLEIRERQRALNVLRQNVIDYFFEMLSHGADEIIKNCLISLNSVDGGEEAEEDLRKLWEVIKSDQMECSFKEVAALLSVVFKMDDFRNFVSSFSVRYNPHVEFLLSNVERYASDDTYQPSDQEILHLRMKSTGVQEITIRVPETEESFILVDVGGQRSERRKWIHCFDGVHLVLFVCAMDEYNLSIMEESRCNRLTESLQLFETLSETTALEGKRFLLFLNKFDVFKDKIKKVPLHEYVEGADPDKAHDVDYATAFMERLYRSRFRQRQALLDVYTTCALDTNNCKKVFNAIVNTRMRMFLAASGLNGGEIIAI